MFETTDTANISTITVSPYVLNVMRNDHKYA